MCVRIFLIAAAKSESFPLLSLLLVFFFLSFSPKFLPWHSVRPEGSPWGAGPLGPACLIRGKHRPCTEAEAPQKHEGHFWP